MSALNIALIFVLAALTSSRLTGDFDCDGRPDTAFLTQGGGRATVRVVFADRSHPPQVFRFVADPAREDAVCRFPVYLKSESLNNGSVRSKRCPGFALVDNTCDSIHFYWDHSTKRLSWWRE
jgi:hypothetical protein